MAENIPQVPPGAAPRAALFRNLSAADKQEMWDLPINRGKRPDDRPQAARWADSTRQCTSWSPTFSSTSGRSLDSRI